MEDLTKLSGPELADLLDSFDADEYVAIEAARRLREDTREWQRRLERERDGLRERVRELEEQLDSWRKWAAYWACNAGEDKGDADMMGAIDDAAAKHSDELMSRIAELESELTQCKATMAGMHEARGELQRELDAARAEPAERKAQEERRYGTRHPSATLDELILNCVPETSWHDALCHLRETLATIDAVRALAEEHRGGIVYGDRLLEVLNGKR